MDDALFAEYAIDRPSGAEFSPYPHIYRYRLWRNWEVRNEKKLVMFIGLNPSTADAKEDDPTIRRCIGFAKSWGYSGMLMLNAFAYRATDPKVMLKLRHGIIIGTQNDFHLGYEADKVDMTVVCWGFNCPVDREKKVLEILRKGAYYTPIYCFGHTKAGRPKHPLYLPADTKLQLFS